MLIRLQEPIRVSGRLSRRYVWWTRQTRHRRPAHACLGPNMLSRSSVTSLGDDRLAKARPSHCRPESKLTLSIGKVPPTPGIVNQYYNISTGEGDFGEVDGEGPWLDDLELVPSPAMTEFQVMKATTRSSKTTLGSGSVDSGSGQSGNGARSSTKRRSKSAPVDEDNTLGLPPQ